MKWLTREELLALLKVARSHSVRDWLLVLVSFSHGLRVSELVGLTKANFRDAHITVRRLKGSLKTTQALLSSAEPLLDEKTAVEAYLRTLGPKDRLFPITRYGVAFKMKQFCTEAGIPAHKASPHKLKHTTGMLMIQGGAGIEAVRQYLGHRSLASTGEYIRINDEAASVAFSSAMGGAQ